METDQPLTYDEKFYNYRRLVDTIQFIDQGGRITEDWMETHKQILGEYRNAFPDSFRAVNPEIKHKEFRTLAEESGVLLDSLMTSIQYEKKFKVGHYRMLLTRMLRMVDLVNEYHDDGDELTSFMQNMSLG